MPQTIPEKIAQVSGIFGIDSLLAVNIAYAESRFYEKAKNPTSSAKGIFQIIDGTWEQFDCVGDPLNGDDNINCGVKIMKESGYQHWSSSAYIWTRLPYKRD